MWVKTVELHGNIFQPIKYGESMIIYQHTGLNNSGNHINFMHIFWIEFTVRLLYSQGHRQSWPFRLQKSNNYSCLRKFVVTHTRKNKKTWIKSNQYYNLQTWSFEPLKKVGFVRSPLEWMTEAKKHKAWRMLLVYTSVTPCLMHDSRSRKGTVFVPKHGKKTC